MLKQIMDSAHIYIQYAPTSLKYCMRKHTWFCTDFDGQRGRSRIKFDTPRQLPLQQYCNYFRYSSLTQYRFCKYILQYATDILLLPW